METISSKTRAYALPRTGFWFEYTGERVARRLLGTTAVLLIIAYGYLIASSTFNIIARKEAYLTSTKIESALAQLEAEYFELSESLTASYAAQTGLTPVVAKEYAARAGTLGLVQSGE
jgi:hypothetical protein